MVYGLMWCFSESKGDWQLEKLFSEEMQKQTSITKTRKFENAK
jgi:hypothetical protein